MANVVTYPASIVAAYNLVRIVQDSDSPELIIGWTDKNGTEKSVSLSRQSFNGEAVFDIESILQSLFGDFQSEDVTFEDGRVAGVIPPELSGEYMINGEDGFAVARASLKKGEATANDLLQLSKKFLTERPALGDGSVAIPVYEGYPSGVCVRSYSPDVSLEPEYPYVIQRERLFDEEGFENHGCLRLNISCDANMAWSLSCEKVGDAEVFFSQSEGVGPTTVLYWAEIPNVGEDNGYFVDPGTKFTIICRFRDISVATVVEAVGEPLMIKGEIIQGGNMNLVDGGDYGCPFLLNAGTAFIWGEATDTDEDIVPRVCTPTTPVEFPIYNLPSSGESVVSFYAAPCPDAVFRPITSEFALDEVFNPDTGIDVSWGAAVFSTANSLILLWTGAEFLVGIRPFGKGFSNVTNFYEAFGCRIGKSPRLGSIYSNLFVNCPEATTMEGIFGNQTNLLSIPPSLFDNCRKVTDFDSAFYGCTELTGETPYTVLDSGEKVKLWERSDYPDEFADVTTHSQCFKDCTGLDDYSEIPNSWR